MGTSIAAVSRIESAGDPNYRPSPSISTLQRYAAAPGCRLVLKLEPIGFQVGREDDFVDRAD
jgi:hypothetical protein